MNVELTNENRMEVEAQRKDRKKQEEEATEGLKRLGAQEMAREPEEVLLASEAQDPEAEGTGRLQELLRMQSRADTSSMFRKIQLPLNVTALLL